MANRRKRAPRRSKWNKLWSKAVSSQFMPILFTFAVIGALYVFTRMKGIEQDYKFNELAKRIQVQKIQNKELKARKARELSVKKLKAYANRFNLKEPDDKHIIVIPSK